MNDTVKATIKTSAQLPNRLWHLLILTFYNCLIQASFIIKAIPQGKP